MKFEANIPSYLKTGAGSFPVGSKGAPKSVNFFDSMQTNMDKVEPVNPFKPKPIGPLPDDPTKPVNPFTPKPKEIAKTDEKTNEDIFIG